MSPGHPYVVNEAVAQHLVWLEEASEVAEWAIDTGEEGQQVRALTTRELEAIAGHLHLPPSIRHLAGRRDLQRRIRSVTACYLDLGDFAVPTSSSDGWLLHFLSDQQWCRHWLLFVDAAGHEAVVTSAEPIGFVLPDDWENAPPRVIPLDGSFDLEVCADSFVEFLERFWIENELWYAIQSDSPLPRVVATYAAELPLAD